MKKPKILVFILVAMALVLSVAIPVLASNIGGEKSTLNPVNVFYISDTINYEMAVFNPEENRDGTPQLQTNYLTEVYDLLPDGSIHYFVQPGVDPPLVQAPGEVNYFYIDYVVDAADLITLTAGPYAGRQGVVNQFFAEGYDTLGDIVRVSIERNSLVILPDTLVNITASEEFVIAGGTVNLTVTEENTGDDPLTNVSVTVNDGTSDIANLVYPPVSGDANANGVLDPGEVWSWTISNVELNATTTFTATGYGLDSLGNPVTWPDYPNERDMVTVTVVNPSIDIEKATNGFDADNPTGPVVMVGAPITWTYVVTNTGDVDLTDIVVTDNMGEIPVYVSGDDGDNILQVGETWIYEATGTAVAGQYANIGTVTGNWMGYPVSDSDPSHYFAGTPSITIDKTADFDLSKVGDELTYNFSIENTGDVDVDVVSVIDSVIGDITGYVPAAGQTLSPGETTTFSVVYVVQPDDPNPLINTVTANYIWTLQGQVVSASDSWTVDLFTASLTIDKTADFNLSKAGDDVEYTITVTNTSSANAPDMDVNIVDAMLGLDIDVVLASGGIWSDSYTYTIPMNAVGSVVNTATATGTFDDYPNIVNVSDSWTVSLFTVDWEFTKTGDELSKIGDPVDYTITFTNLSSANAPDLVVTITDAMLGIDETVTLASGQTHTINYFGFIIFDECDDPFVNTAYFTASPIGYPNVYTGCASWTTNLFQPSVQVVKGGDTMGIVGESVTYNFTITNTSSSDSPDLILVSVIDNVLGDLTANAAVAGGDRLAPGESINFTVERVVKNTDPSPLVNTVTVTYNPEGFPNEVTDSDDHSVVLYRWGKCYDETFWAYGGDAAKANNTVAGNRSNNWGWTNYIDAEGTYTWDLYAAAGQNNLSKGYYIGTLTVEAYGDTIVVTYQIDTSLVNNYTIEEAHLWVGSTPLPLDRRGTPTSAPGQFSYSPTISSDGLTATYTVDISGMNIEDGIWIAAHGVVAWCELVPV